MPLFRKPEPPDRPTEMQGRRLFGNPDLAFLQTQPHRGLLTPAEVRAIATFRHVSVWQELGARSARAGGGPHASRYRINRLGGRSQRDKWVLQAELFNELHRWVRGRWRA